MATWTAVATSRASCRLGESVDRGLFQTAPRVVWRALRPCRSWSTLAWTWCQLRGAPLFEAVNTSGLLFVATLPASKTRARMPTHHYHTTNATVATTAVLTLHMTFSLSPVCSAQAPQASSSIDVDGYVDGK